MSLRANGRVVRFGAFDLDLDSGELRKHGLRTRLTPQSFQVLLLLLEHRGELVTREALQKKLWPADTFVDFEMGLSSAVKKLREALGDSAESPRFVETLPRRGYRFVATIEAGLPPAPPGPPLPPVAAAPARRVRRWSWRAALMMTAVAAALIALHGAGLWRWALHPMRAAAAPIRSIAVLPLANLSGDPAQDYFADGMTDALITELAQVGSLRVISRTSVTQYKGMARPVGTIARELGVEAVVEGTVARDANRVRVTAQLIDAGSDRHLWAHTYERELRDVLTLQDEIAAAIAQAVEAEIRPGERHARAVDPAAYESYLKGRFFWSPRQTDGLFKAAELFEAAIRQDPTYAPSYSGLSDTYRLFDMHGLMRPGDCMPRAEAAARQALALDDTLAEAHVSLATVLFRYRWDWAGAEREFRRALDLDPSYAEGHRAYAVYLLAVQRPEAALGEARLARQLNPLSPIVRTELAFALLGAGQVDDAIAELEKTRHTDPGFLRVYHSLAIAYLRKGDTPRAAAAVEEGLARSSGEASPWLAYVGAVVGRRRVGVETLAALEKRSRSEYVSPQSFAVVHLGLGDTERALGLLEKASDERAIEWLGFATVVTERLRGQPRFIALERRLGLPAVATAAAGHGR